MATYHICDLCGKDLKDGSIYFIAVGPSISVRKPIDEDINEVRKSYFFERIEPHSNKEVCKECALAYSRSLDEAEKRRDSDKKTLAIGIAETSFNKEYPEITFFAFGNYNND